MSTKPTVRDVTTVEKKLALRKTTLRNLTGEDLEQVVGGGAKSVYVHGRRRTW